MAPLDLIISRASGELKEYEINFITEILRQSPFLILEGENCLFAIKELAMRFEPDSFKEFLDTVGEILPQDKSYDKLLKTSKFYLDHFNNLVEHYKTNGQKVITLGRNATEQYIQEIYGIDIPIDLLFKGTLKDIERICSEIDVSLWNKVKGETISGEPDVIKDELKRTLTDIIEKINHKELEDPAVLSKVTERLIFEPTPVYLRKKIHSAAILRAPIF